MRYGAFVLEMAVLGLLKEQDMHGYELKRRLADVFGLVPAVSFGSLYPALARLEVAQAVHMVASPPLSPADAPHVGDRRGSRRRKVYGITPVGGQMFVELLASSQNSGEDERSFNLRLAFARYLPPEGRIGLLEQRRAVLGERLAQLAARARARRDDRYMKVLSQRQQEELSSDVSWLDQLIREERAASSGLGSVTLGKAHRPVPLASASQLQRVAPARP
jgi:DNA-binding PadR family transcriptional regulator